jgi:hypothetical protein
MGAAVAVAAGASAGTNDAVGGRGRACWVKSSALCVASASRAKAAAVTAASVTATSVAKKSLNGVGVSRRESDNGDSGTNPLDGAPGIPGFGVVTELNPNALVAVGKIEMTTLVGVGVGGTVGVVVGMGVSVGVHV